MQVAVKSMSIHEQDPAGDDCQFSGKLSREERDELVLEYRIRARKLARSLLRRWNIYLDLESVDSVVDLSLCEAVTRFDPDRGAGFMTFMYYHLRGNLMRLITDSVQHTGVLEGRHPVAGSKLEEEEETILGPDDIIAALHSGGHRSPDDLLAHKELFKLSLDACSKLDTLGRQVIKRFYFLGEPITDIAVSMGYSRSHVSRVKTRALTILHEELTALIESTGDKKLLATTRARFAPDSPERPRIRRRRPRSRKAVSLQSMAVKQSYK